MLESPIIATNRLLIGIPSIDDAGAVCQYHGRNKNFHRDSTPLRDDSFYTEKNTADRIRKFKEDFLADHAVQLYFKINHNPNTIIGHIGLTQISRGPFQAAFLGYGLDHAYTRSGYMTEGLGSVIFYAFNKLKLHRLMANYQPINEASARLLMRLGFEIEGRAKDYLFLNGEWRDHVITSLVNKDFVW